MSVLTAATALAAATTRRVNHRHIAGVHMNQIPMAWGSNGTTPGWSAEARPNEHVPSGAGQPESSISGSIPWL